MKLKVSSIPLEGLEIFFNPRMEWLQGLVNETLKPESPSIQTLDGNLWVYCVEKQVEVKGKVSLMLNPICHRCMNEFFYPYLVDIHMHLTPHEHEREQDLEFSFYDGIVVDLKEVLRDQLVLALPVQWLCLPSCRGLCPQCGINLNHSLCLCSHKTFGAPLTLNSSHSNKKPPN